MAHCPGCGLELRIVVQGVERRRDLRRAPAAILPSHQAAIEKMAAEAGFTVGSVVSAATGGGRELRDLRARVAQWLARVGYNYDAIGLYLGGRTAKQAQRLVSRALLVASVVARPKGRPAKGRYALPTPPAPAPLGAEEPQPA